MLPEVAGNPSELAASRGRHEDVRRTVALAGVELVVLLVSICAVSACTATDDRTTAGSSPAPGCAAQVHRNQLPEWARAGFSGDARAIYAVSRAGRMVAVLFGYPLTQPPAPDRNNKILWVSAPAADTSAEPGSDDLVIDARLDGRGEPVQQRIAGGPGPSIVDLPAPGCWRLALALVRADRRH